MVQPSSCRIICGLHGSAAAELGGALLTSSITASTCCCILANTGWPAVWRMAASSWLDAGSSALASEGSSTSTSRSRIMLLTSEEMRLQDVNEFACHCRRQ